MTESQKSLLNGINELIKQYNSEGNDQLTVIDQTQLESLLNKVEGYEKDIADLVYVIESVITFLGLADEQTKKIRPEFLPNAATGEKGENPMPTILKSALGLVSLLTQAGVRGRFGQTAREKVEEKFAFIEKLLPMLKKYS